jgi:hypothetical protein
MPGSRGFVLWRGPSRFMLDVPLAVVITFGSGNRKTGPMDQAWILRSDVHPLHATRTSQDVAICGDCRHRGDVERGIPRSCYVTVQHGPAAIYRALRLGRYPTVEDPFHVMKGRFLRIGAYGDPTAVPIEIWLSILDGLAGWTGYTHFWKDCNPRFKNFLMASVDTEAERAAALTMGWRTFRVRTTSSVLSGEAICPASQEAGKRLTCQECRMCSGTSGRGQTRSICIYAHGPKMSFYRSAQDALNFNG